MIQADFIIAAKSARLIEPAEGSLDDPATGQYLEAFERIASPHNLQVKFAKGAEVLDPSHQRSQVTTVGPDDLQAAIHTNQKLERRLDPARLPE